MCVMFLFKQKTAYEMRISDWISDVCSSDLVAAKSFCHQSTSCTAGSTRTVSPARQESMPIVVPRSTPSAKATKPMTKPQQSTTSRSSQSPQRARKSVVSGKRVSVRVDLRGRSIIKKKNQITTYLIFIHALLPKKVKN